MSEQSQKRGVPVARPAQPADACLVSALLYEFNGQALPPEVLSRRMAEVQGMETAFLGELGSEVAGILVFRTALSLSDPERWAEITEMYVRPAFRRKGVGKALIDVAMEYGRSLGCREVHLLVDPCNFAAQSFYETAGFCRDAWEMRRSL